MAKFHGRIGFVTYEETSPSRYEPVCEEREYAGDLLTNTNRYVGNSTINDSLVINCQISVIADPYLNSHYPSIRYVNHKGYNWKVTSIDDANYPRIILTLGDVYNGEQA